MTENEFFLQDRITKIKSINEQYDLENNSYISFSGGKDSTVLSELIDMALPNNKIPRINYYYSFIILCLIFYIIYNVFVFNSGIKKNPTINLNTMLVESGYPFKSKEHSLYVSVYQNSGNTKTVKRYLNRGNRFECPEKLKYQFTDEFKIKVSNKCCYKLKKEPAEKWAKENNKSITITGMRSTEGGLRAELKGCVIFSENNELKKFHPLQPMTENFVDWIISKYDIKLCKLYYPPFNFKRTGCKGCPYNIHLQEQLDVMAIYLPNEKKQCEKLWHPIYQEYRRIGYRLINQKCLFEV